MKMISFLDLCSSIATNSDISSIIRTVYDGIRIGVPIILIIIGMIELGKAISQQKEDEIKKAQSTLIKQAIAAVIVFLMFSLVKLVIGIVGGTDNETTCIDIILNGCPSGKQVQAATCTGATGNTPADCTANGGTWSPISCG